MVIEFHCHECDRLLRTTDDKAGLSASCPDCAAPLVVPQPDDEGSHEPAASSSGWDDREAGETTSPPEQRRGGTQQCSMCGETISTADRYCPWCGAAQTSRSARGGMRPHRAGLTLLLAILGWIGILPLAIGAWVLASQDLQEMQAGRMDREGEALTRAARGIAILACIVYGSGILLACLFSVLLKLL